MRILLLEDDEQLCYTLSYQLEKTGFTVDTCANGLDAQDYIEANLYDIILLDRMLPGMDGLTVLKKMRDSGNDTPVILTTALGDLYDKVKGLDCGADDYLVKPFAFGELMARIRCIGRRPHELKTDDTISFCDLTFTPLENKLTGPSGSYTLSKKEGELFEFFVRNKGQVLSRSTLLTKVWGAYGEVEDGNLDNYIHFLRRRIKSVGSQVSIKTTRGVGYSLEENDV